MKNQRVVGVAIVVTMMSLIGAGCVKNDITSTHVDEGAIANDVDETLTTVKETNTNEVEAGTLESESIIKDTETNTETLPEYERVVNEFVSDLGDGHIEDAYNLVDIKYTDLVTVDDFKNGLVNTRFNDLIGTDVSDVQLTVPNDSLNDEVVIVDGEDTTLVKLVNINGKYKLDLDNTGVYLTNLEIKIPNNIEEFIGNINLKEFAYDKDDKYTYIKIPQLGCVAKSVKKVVDGVEKSYKINPIELSGSEAEM